MSSATESSQDSDAENEQLTSHLLQYYDQEKDSNSSKFFNSRQQSWAPLSKSSLITLLSITVLISMLLSGLGLHFLHLLNPPQSSRSLPLPGARFGSCGSTPSSARLANCTFDMMSFSWLPQPCSDPELTAEFTSLRNWTWWLDTNRTSSVSFEEISRGEHRELFVTREYHMYHCTYMWRKLHRGMLKGSDDEEGRGVVDTYIGEYGHTAHCEMMLLGMGGDEGIVDRNVTDTAILMKFPQCMWI